MHALLIEDDDLLATAIIDVLRECGFTSFDIAPSAGMAVIASARRTPDPITSEISLALGCDIAAVEQLAGATTMPVLFITSGPDDVTRRKPNNHVIENPFSTRTLTAAVASAMLKLTTSQGSGRPTFAIRFGSAPCG